jgi:phospholipase/carboxylesterase
MRLGHITRLAVLTTALLGCSKSPPDSRTAALTTPAVESQASLAGPVWREAAGLRVLEVTRGPQRGKLPTVVIIHGRGDTAHARWIDGFDEPARYYFPQAPLPFHDGYSWFQYSARSGVDQLAEDIEDAAKQLAKAIGVLTRAQPTQGKVIVAGFSQGAMLSYALALRHPDQIALAAPVAGLLPAALYEGLPEQGVRYPPIFAIHGDADSVVPFEYASQMTQTLRDKGMQIYLEAVPDLGHSLSGRMQRYMLDRLRQGIESQRNLR